MTSPKQWGGLGIKDLKVCNKALLRTWLWRFRMDVQALRRGVDSIQIWVMEGGDESMKSLCLLGLEFGGTS